MVDGHGKLPKWPKGSDCKSAVYDFVSSNLALATITSANIGPPRHETGLSRFDGRASPEGGPVPMTVELLEALIRRIRQQERFVRPGRVGGIRRGHAGSGRTGNRIFTGTGRNRPFVARCDSRVAVPRTLSENTGSPGSKVCHHLTDSTKLPFGTECRSLYLFVINLRSMCPGTHGINHVTI